MPKKLPTYAELEYRTLRRVRRWLIRHPRYDKLVLVGNLDMDRFRNISEIVEKAVAKFSDDEIFEMFKQDAELRQKTSDRGDSGFYEHMRGIIEFNILEAALEFVDERYPEVFLIQDVKTIADLRCLLIQELKKLKRRPNSSALEGLHSKLAKQLTPEQRIEIFHDLIKSHPAFHIFGSPAGTFFGRAVSESTWVILGHDPEIRVLLVEEKP